MSLRVPIAILSIIPVACASAVACAAPALAACPPPSAEDHFFPSSRIQASPLDVFSGPPWGRGSWSPLDPQDFYRPYYSRHLRAMSEPSLRCGVPVDATVYRFLWLRTFDRPIAVRITESAGRIVLEGVELDGKGGYDPGKVAHKVRKEITPDQWWSLRMVVDSAGLWRPTLGTQIGGGGLDGASWIFESSRRGAYGVMHFSSDASAQSRAAGLMFVGLAGMMPPEREVY